MYPMIRIAIVFLILFASVSSQAQTMVMNERCAMAVDRLLNLERNAAHALIEEEQRQNPENAMVHYLLNLSDFLTVVVTEDQSFFEQQEEKRNTRIKTISKVDASNPYRKFALAEVNLQWAFSRLRFKEYFKAAMEINKAFHLLEENIEEHPDFLPNMKGMGLLHALIGTVPDQYRWATDLMGVEGTVSGGLSELRKAVVESRNRTEFAFLEKESLFLYSFIVLNLTNDISSLNAVEEPLSRLAMESPLVAFAQASVLSEKGKTVNAIELLESCGYQNRDLRFLYLDHLLGTYKLYAMGRSAERSLKYYAEHFKGKSYLKANQLMLAYHRLIFFNSEEMFRQKLAQINEIGNTMLDEDKQAQRTFEKGIIPNKELLKGRLQFDGRFNNEALNTLSNIDRSSLTSIEKLELDYRMGRIYHESGNLDSAKFCYLKAVNDHSIEGTYYPANACLKLGEIIELQGNDAEAIGWYERSYELDGHEYENSIEQKAKAAISRLR